MKEIKITMNEMLYSMARVRLRNDRKILRILESPANKIHSFLPRSSLALMQSRVSSGQYSCSWHGR